MSEQENDYEVGYGRPPKRTQFKKGQSGNPKGRPKGAMGLNASLKRELESKITIREGNREIRVSKAEAMAKRLAANALKGDMKALMVLQKIDAALFDDIAAQESDAGQPGAAEPVDYEILRHYFAGDADGDGESSDQETDIDHS